MKRMILILFCSLIALNDNIQAKELPEFVQYRLDSLQKETRRILKEYRVWNYQTSGSKTLPFTASDPFLYEECLLIDSLGLNLDVGIIYDEAMRNRIVQLIRNEFQEWELDSLINRQMEYHIASNESKAMNICKFDTMQIFKTALDSFYIDLKNKSTTDSLLYEKYTKYETFYKKEMRFDIFKLLKLDTTAVFKQTYQKAVERERERERERQLTNMYSYFSAIGYLAELCGYIRDKRFVQPLIEVLNKPFEFDSQWKESVQEKVTEALVRMRVEPYYSDYVKQRTRTLEDIKTKNINFRIEDLTDVLRTQESFLELSKYLLSDTPYRIEYRDAQGGARYPIYTDAFSLIKDNIENEEVQEITGKNYREDYTPYLKPLYDWMQKNYGKYKIRRIW